MSMVVTSRPERRSIWQLLAAVAVSGVLASSANAEPAQLTNGTFQLQIAALNPVSIQAAGASPAATVTRNGANAITDLSFTAGGPFLSAAKNVLPVTDPAAAPIKGVQVTVANQAGHFQAGGGPTAGGGAAFGGSMPLSGVDKVCLFGPCSAAVANLEVPVNVVGLGGAAQVTAAVNLTVIGAPWTTGTVAIGTITHMGGTMPPSPVNGDYFSLVTPIFVSTNIGASAVVPVFGVFNFTVSTPEPATVGMAGAAIATLIGIGISRRRKS